MKKSLYLFLLIMTQFIFGKPFELGEILSYTAGFRVVSAGESTLEIKSDSLNNNLVYHITSTVNSNSFLDIFYKVRDIIDIWVDPNDFSLLKMTKNIREGKYRKKKQFEVTYNDSLINNQYFIYLDSKVFDPFSAIYFLRTQILTIDRQFIFPMFDGNKVKEIAVSVIGNEKINVPAGTFDCIFVAPSSTDGSRFKHNGEMKIWFSNDSLKLPVKIEQQTNIGTMLLELKNISKF